MEKLMFPSFLLFSFLAFASGFYIQPAVVTFTIAPESVVVQEGGRVELSCAVADQRMYTATTLPHPEIQWLVNGTMVSESAFSGTVQVTSDTSIPSLVSQRLVIPASSPAHQGWYQCRATDGHDPAHCDNGDLSCVRTVVLSDRAWVQVIGNTTESVAVQAPVWSSVLLECGSQLVSAGQNGMRIVWNRNEQELENGMNEYLLSSGDLFVSVASDLHNVTYDCLVYLADTAVHYQSYWMNVSQSQGLSSVVLPFSRVHTASPIALVGQTVELTCSFQNPSPSNVSWVLRGAEGNDTPLRLSAAVRHHLRDHVLVLEEVSLEDEGMYCCQIRELSTENCVEIGVVAEATLVSAPVQVFVNFRDNSIPHVLDFTCPQYLLSLPVTWFRNGIKLSNSSERNLIRTDSNPELLYGMYQCVIGSLDLHQDGRNAFHTVARVMPYGISNPPGNIIEDEQPWPNSSAVIATYLHWTAPNYTGNLSSLSYKISYFSNDCFSDKTSLLRFLGDTSYTVRLSVYDSVLGSLSDVTRKFFSLDFSCQLEVLFPPIPILSCDMGSPQLSLAPNVTADSVYGSGAAVLNAPRVNYLEGGCLDLENTLVYESFPNVSYGNHVTFGGGMTFEAGTWCTLQAANTVREDHQRQDRRHCYDPQRIYYADHFVECYVRASVGFANATYLVNEGEGFVVVCVEAKGYGFTVNLTVRNITASESDYNYVDQYQLAFTSPIVSNRVCINVSINDDMILEPLENMQLLLSSTSEFVQFQASGSHVTIVDNDNVRVGFQSEHISRMESQGNVVVCIEMEGELEKTIAVAVNSTNGMHELHSTHTYLCEDTLNCLLSNLALFT